MTGNENLVKKFVKSHQAILFLAGFSCLESLCCGGRKFDSEIKNLILYWVLARTSVGNIMGFFVDRELPSRGYMSDYLTFVLS